MADRADLDRIVVAIMVRQGYSKGTVDKARRELMEVFITYPSLKPREQSLSKR